MEWRSEQNEAEETLLYHHDLYLIKRDKGRVEINASIKQLVIQSFIHSLDMMEKADAQSLQINVKLVQIIVAQILHK